VPPPGTAASRGSARLSTQHGTQFPTCVSPRAGVRSLRSSKSPDSARSAPAVPQVIAFPTAHAARDALHFRIAPPGLASERWAARTSHIARETPAIDGVARRLVAGKPNSHLHTRSPGNADCAGSALHLGMGEDPPKRTTTPSPLGQRARRGCRGDAALPAGRPNTPSPMATPLAEALEGRQHFLGPARAKRPPHRGDAPT
jgi:hypothetical protein